MRSTPFSRATYKNCSAQARLANPPARWARGAHYAQSFSAAIRKDKAAIVSAGFCAPYEGKKAASAINRFATSWLRPSPSTTLVSRSAPPTAVPHMWLFMSMVKRCSKIPM